MSHHPIRVLSDGTRIYHGGKRYKPLTAVQRTYRVKKPVAPEAVRFHGKWFLPLELLHDAQRGPVPRTRADSEAYGHVAKPRRCKCDVCKGPGAERYRRLAEAHLRSGSFPDPAVLRR